MTKLAQLYPKRFNTTRAAIKNLFKISSFKPGNPWSSTPMGI
jgi:hypothetical protein